MVAAALNVERHEVHAGEALAALLKQVVRHLLRDPVVDRLHGGHQQAAKHLVNDVLLHGDVGVLKVGAQRQEARWGAFEHRVQGKHGQVRLDGAVTKPVRKRDI